MTDQIKESQKQEQDQGQDTIRSQIIEQKDKLEHEIWTLYESINSLTARLEGVLRNFEFKIADKTIEAVVFVMLEDALIGFVRDVKDVKLRIDELIT